MTREERPGLQQPRPPRAGGLPTARVTARTSAAAAAKALTTPLASLSRIDELTDRLVTAIAIGEYLPGSRLPSERDLAASLQVGRMTVRAALARLVERGLLETQRGRGGGSFVREQWLSSSGASVQRTLSTRWDSLRDTCEAVSRLQGTVARAAAENRTDADVQHLRDRLDAFRLAESGLHSQKADELLHLAIISASGNETLKAVLLELESRVSIVAPAHLWGSPEGMGAMEARALADHENLVEAICDRRADDAGRIAREHAHIDLELLEVALKRSANAE
ncbi:MAG: transcriptional regulator [Cryobacterium sp.]|jgi:GntR family transcriptional repressor for pyruvate dehydrogenase complex|nr:transcriptional regulator [Cryobacterium sp.]